MKTYLDCYLCLMRNALESARFVRLDERAQREVLMEVMEVLKEIDPEDPPPKQAQQVHRRIREVTGLVDPYAEAKAEQNAYILKVEPKLVDYVNKSGRSLITALMLAGSCNAIDMGAKRSWRRVEELYERLIDPRTGRFEARELEKAIGSAKRLLYIGDNAGEVVGDKILISVLKKKLPIEVVFAVRGGPILNDVTALEAKEAGIEDVAEIVSTGTDCPGVILEESSPELRKEFEEADVVLAKGQGNYESLEKEAREIFFLLQVKCDIVARDLQMPVGNIILFRKAAQGNGN